jgi:hypothetical protein
MLHYFASGVLCQILNKDSNNITNNVFLKSLAKKRAANRRLVDIMVLIRT